MIPLHMDQASTLALWVFLFFLFGGWLYRIGRALSELRHAPMLKPCSTDARKGSVSVLIPAKNEALNIADCVRSFLPQLGDTDEVIVINNSSTDDTETILRSLGAQTITPGSSESPPPGKVPLKYLNTPPTPEDWTGKNFALHLGIQHAHGDWFLFTDADTRHQPGSINASVSLAEKSSLDLLTLLPRCLAHGFWENLVQPCAMAYMGLWFPLREVNDPRSKTFFANGQYLLIRKDHYTKVGGHLAVKAAFLEDFALMKKTKEMSRHGFCGFGMDVYGTRMYGSFEAIWRGWRRIFLHAYERRPALLFRCFASVVCFSVLPLVILVGSLTGSRELLILSALITALSLGTAVKAYSIVRARKAYALLHPFAAMIFAGILCDAFRMALFKQRTHWR
ncbi:MAG: glycosyltransferase [Candidatus Omnitrophica bacterium]|nr:glycosyltransferase [Candidatus Omnitrophota bacterium]